MKRLFLPIVATMIFTLAGCQHETESATENKPEVRAKPETATVAEVPARPSDAELNAYKVYHHARYMVQTAEKAGGTNKLLHTRKLPTEGTDDVVTPALDHLYSKAVIDLSSGPVTVEFPEGITDRYWSIHVTDQEHYTIFYQIRPVGAFTFVRKGENMEVPEGATVIESPGDYPHLFIRTQVQTPDDLANTVAIQDQIKPGRCINMAVYLDETVLYKGYSGCDNCVAGPHR